MTRIISIVLLFLTFNLYGQNQLAVKAGFGLPTFGLPIMKYGIAHSSYLGPTTAISYLWNGDERIFLGGQLFFQRISFDYVYSRNGASYSESEEIRTVSNYIFLAPILDFGLGKRRTVHFYISPALGYLISGKQTTHDYAKYQMGQASNIDTRYRNDDKISKMTTRLDIGFEEDVWENEKWHIILNEGLGLISGKVTTLARSEKEVHPGFLYIQAGLMKKYKIRRSLPAIAE